MTKIAFLFEILKCIFGKSGDKKTPKNQQFSGVYIVLLFRAVRMKGLEPPRREAPDPKSGVATNYTTSAKRRQR